MIDATIAAVFCVAMAYCSFIAGHAVGHRRCLRWARAERESLRRAHERRAECWRISHKINADLHKRTLREIERLRRSTAGKED